VAASSASPPRLAARRAWYSSQTIGITEMITIATITSSKRFFTNSMFPNA
jgi:hypothetical protein